MRLICVLGRLGYMVNNNQHSKVQNVVMYHDGECPLCKFEVKTMQKLDVTNAISWVDISKDKEALEKVGISYEDAMARVHVQDENQNMLTGVAGFIQVWKHLPYYRRLAWLIVNIPILLAVAEYFYSWFAKYRLPLTGKNQLEKSVFNGK